MENNLNNLENNYIKNYNKNNNKNTSINNKNLLIEILLKNNYNRDIIPVKTTVLYFNKINNLNPSSELFNKKIISIKNSLDTLISNFNNINKIKNDQDLNNLKLIKTINNYKLIK